MPSPDDAPGIGDRGQETGPTVKVGPDGYGVVVTAGGSSALSGPSAPSAATARSAHSARTAPEASRGRRADHGRQRVEPSAVTASAGTPDQADAAAPAPRGPEFGEGSSYSVEIG